jgi:HD-GYP domain-containing protein (c-di-GMP phosphodiesterase class II)
MYAAKKLGRNQVRSIADPIVDTLESGPDGSRESATLEGTIEALAGLADARNSFKSTHVNDVAALAKQIGRVMGLDTSAVSLVGMVGKLHDIGKVAIPDVILQNKGVLNEMEWTLMRTHPIIGADVVSRVPTLRMTAPGIRGHHERWDGRGYPDGLAGEDIPLAARIVAVADSYSAMTSDRPYQSARTSGAALQELVLCAGSHFDPAVVAAAEKVLGAPAESLKIAA